MTDSPTEQPLPEVAPMSGLDLLLERIRERSARFEAMLDEQPPVLPCPVHGADRRVLDRDASLKAARPVHTCARCDGERLLRRHAERMDDAGVPPDVRHATLTNFDTERPGVVTEPGFNPPAKFLQAAHDFAEGRVRNVLFCGTPGIGKGHLAAALARAELEKGRRVRWLECARLFADYHRAYKTDTTAQIMHPLIRADLLILDELCLRDLPADGEEILFTLFDGRQKSARPTICLGNKSAHETRHWLGSRISDRLRSGGVTFCYGSWQSMRGGAGDGAEF
jgi:DNA replication protein DnaC